MKYGVQSHKEKSLRDIQPIQIKYFQDWIQSEASDNVWHAYCGSRRLGLVCGGECRWGEHTMGATSPTSLSCMRRWTPWRLAGSWGISPSTQHWEGSHRQHLLPRPAEENYRAETGVPSGYRRCFQSIRPGFQPRRLADTHICRETSHQETRGWGRRKSSLSLCVCVGLCVCLCGCVCTLSMLRYVDSNPISTRYQQ